MNRYSTCRGYIFLRHGWNTMVFFTFNFFPVTVLEIQCQRISSLTNIARIRKSGTLSSVHHREETMHPTTRVAAGRPAFHFWKLPALLWEIGVPVSEYTFSAKGRRGYGHLDYIYGGITPVFIGFLSCLDNVRPHTCTKGIVFCFSTNLRENSFWKLDIKSKRIGNRPRILGNQSVVVFSTNLRGNSPWKFGIKSKRIGNRPRILGNKSVVVSVRLLEAFLHFRLSRIFFRDWFFPPFTSFKRRGTGFDVSLNFLSKKRRPWQ